MTQNSKTPARSTAASRAKDAAAIANFKRTISMTTGDNATKEIAEEALGNARKHLANHAGGSHVTGLIRLAITEAEWALRVANYRSTVIRANRALSY